MKHFWMGKNMLQKKLLNFLQKTILRLDNFWEEVWKNKVFISIFFFLIFFKNFLIFQNSK
jgi:hypothetical protein